MLKNLFGPKHTEITHRRTATLINVHQRTQSTYNALIKCFRLASSFCLIFIFNTWYLHSRRQHGTRDARMVPLCMLYFVFEPKCTPAMRLTASVYIYNTFVTFADLVFFQHSRHTLVSCANIFMIYPHAIFVLTSHLAEKKELIILFFISVFKAFCDFFPFLAAHEVSL